ncbi:heme biosynthesis protein HemY, partial [Candidatus Falkowbacteria bacterium]|nr:heme biosynthesis protein HemY [Candidatus Falkowbacteria bacterium]
MIWSFVKVALFLVIVAALTLGAMRLADSGEGVRITVADYEFTLGALQAAIVAVLAVIAIWVVFKLLGLALAVIRFIAGDETAISRYFDRSRERKGYEALAEGMLAIASGEGRIAQVKAARAARYLRRPELTTLLAAQAAEVSGDTRKAAAAYKKLLDNNTTRFVG